MMEDIDKLPTNAVVQAGNNPALFTEKEEEILRLTSEIWNKFLELPDVANIERQEMMMKIHEVQRMIISRPGFRMNNIVKKSYG